ncbi:MAG TPA: M23 family metallopeptidase [Thermodesulfovibrionales bacterium]|nr:M23 family metallopeptidase [Thermodesulfovibrionales bacterium]
MSRLSGFIKKAFTPITIMLVPHSNSKHFSIKLPSIGIVLSVGLWLIGSIYVISIAVNAFEYRMMRERLKYYSGQFVELNATIAALKNAESEFRRLFSLGTREEVLENVHITSDSGSIDLEALRNQIKDTVENVKDIKEYLKEQKDIYMATPRGWPTTGRITSPYGSRENPVHGGNDFHSGVDISVESGTPIRATADGVVSFAGRSGGSGNLVGLEHGFGFSTFYAHNSNVVVKIGQRVKRGDIVAYSGSTGSTTGPHCHYEIWKDGRHVNPAKFLEGRS